MARLDATARPHGLGIFSLFLGLLCLLLCWWTPTGMILCLAGLTVGFVGLALSRCGHRGLPVAGLLLSTAALGVCWIIAAWGLEWIRFSALR